MKKQSKFKKALIIGFSIVSLFGTISLASCGNNNGGDSHSCKPSGPCKTTITIG